MIYIKLSIGPLFSLGIFITIYIIYTILIVLFLI